MKIKRIIKSVASVVMIALMQIGCSDSGVSAVAYGEIVDSRDGSVYRTVQIGEQVWMAENLNLACGEWMRDGVCKTPSNKYGKLYSWSIAIDSAGIYSDDGMGCGCDSKCLVSGKVRGICPEGWHIPSLAEWKTLFAFVSDEITAGKYLKSVEGWNVHFGGGNDMYGFSAYPAGAYGSHEGSFGLYTNAYFWTSMNTEKGHPVGLRFNGGKTNIDIVSFEERLNAISVRCIED